MNTTNRGSAIAGGVLIAVGVMIFAMQYASGFEEAVMLFAVGSIFLYFYFRHRKYGLLIPGCILMGLALAVVGDRGFYALGDFDQIGLGLGFLAIYVIAKAYQGRSHWWPLVPGGILVINGLLEGHAAVRRLLHDGWPLLLIAAGILLVARALGMFERREQTAE